MTNRNGVTHNGIGLRSDLSVNETPARCDSKDTLIRTGGHGRNLSSQRVEFSQIARGDLDPVPSPRDAHEYRMNQ